MISSAAAMHAARSLAALNFFPTDENGIVSVATVFSDICETVDQARWLVAKMIRTYNTWPGPRELRACFCTKFRPADGYEVDSAVYADGIPADAEQIATSTPLILPDPSAHARFAGFIDRPMLDLPVDHKAVDLSEPDAQISYSLQVLKKQSTIPPMLPAADAPKRRVLSIRAGEHARQTECGCWGSGRLEGGRYCTCQMGHDLYKVEQKDRMAFNAHQDAVRDRLLEMGL